MRGSQRVPVNAADVFRPGANPPRTGRIFPSQTKPNQAKPSQTKKNQEKPRKKSLVFLGFLRPNWGFSTGYRESKEKIAVSRLACPTIDICALRMSRRIARSLVLEKKMTTSG